MAEDQEFQESEVIFSDNNESTNHFDRIFHVSSKHGRFVKNNLNNNNNNNNNNKKKKKKVHGNDSVPVNIPESVFRFGDVDDRDWMDDEDDDEGEMIPPHVIVGRRVGGGKMAYSVCTGSGRTLKGRDLSQVRNSILRLTGFLET